MVPQLQAMEGGRDIAFQDPLSLEAFPTLCLQCNAHCGVLGFLESNKLVAVYGNPKHPNSRGKICAKGMAEINLTYDPERLLFPLRRAGRRGEGKWKKISWDEAYGEIAQALKRIQSQQDWVFLEVGREEILTRRFLKALNTGRVFFNSDQRENNARKARILTLGEDIIIPDLLHSKYILNFGSNLYENHDFYIPLIARLIEGRTTNRAKLVTFDVRLSHTASQSDEWFPVFPGTDGIVALAMAHVIVREGLFDHDFMKNWTNYPVDALVSHLSSFTPERAEKVSGLKQEDIERIAREFAQTQPAVALSGGGISKHVDGTQNVRCILLLNALVGNIDRKGGCLLPRKLDLKEPSPQPPEAEFLENVTISEAISRAKKENSKIGLYLCYQANPAYSYPQGRSTIELLKDETSICQLIVIDTHLSETAAWADIVLPAASYFECFGVESPPAFELAPFLAFMQPIVETRAEPEALRSTRTAGLTESVIKPLGEAMAWSDILIQVAKRIGGKTKEYFSFGSTEDFLKEIIRQFDELALLGGINYLKKNGVWIHHAGKIDYGSYRAKGFKTPSGKFEIFSSHLKDMGFSPLPSYEAGSLPREGEFILITFTSNLQTYRTANSKWLSEIAHENYTWINKDVARSLGINEGDKVTIESEFGSITGKAYLTAGIHPRAVALAQGFGHWGYGSIARGKRYKSSDPDTDAIWWESNGVDPNPIIPINRDPIGGGQAWMDTKVRISKV